MLNIKATCPTCGDVMLSGSDIRLVIYPRGWSVEDFYTFYCPGGCLEKVVKPANDEIVRLLLTGGVVPERVEIPAEMYEHPEYAPSLNLDIVIDFLAGDFDAELVELLADAAAIGDLLGSAEPATE